MKNQANLILSFFEKKNPFNVWCRCKIKTTGVLVSQRPGGTAHTAKVAERPSGPRCPCCRQTTFLKVRNPFPVLPTLLFHTWVSFPNVL